MLAELRFVKWVPSTHIHAMKEGVVNLINNARSRLEEELAPRLRDGETVDSLRATLSAYLDIFRSLRTERQELSVLHDHLGRDPITTAWIDPVQQDLIDPETGEKSGDFVYDFPVDTLLQRLIVNNPQATLVTHGPAD